MSKRELRIARARALDPQVTREIRLAERMKAVVLPRTLVSKPSKWEVRRLGGQ